MTTLAEVALRRPHRADARRNYDALLDAARQTFAEHGTQAPLDEVARRAGVGIATLYRNFPTREVLVESVYVDEVEAVCAAAAELADGPPWDALVAWLHRYVDFAGTKHVLLEGLNRDSETFAACRDALYPAGEQLLVAAQQAGEARPDARIGDVMRLVSGVAAVGFADDDQRDRILGMAFDALRVGAAG